jgi:hypothetical protein
MSSFIKRAFLLRSLSKFTSKFLHKSLKVVAASEES